MIKSKDEQKKLMELFFMKYEKGKIPRKIEFAVEHFEELAYKFANITSDKIEIEKRGNYIDIYTLTGSIDVRLRSDSAPYPTIAIVKLEPKKLDFWSESLNWLVDYAKQHGFQRLMIENCNTDESICFAKEHGFMPLYQQSQGNCFDLNRSFEMYLDETLLQEIR